MTLGFNFIGKRLDTCSALATSPIIDQTGWPGKSFLYLVQSPFGVITISTCFPEMLLFFSEKLRIATNSFGPMGESTNDTIFSWEMMVAVPLQVLIHVCRFHIYSNRQLTISLWFYNSIQVGMAPSSLLFCTVNCMARSTPLMCCRMFCLFSSFWITDVSSTYQYHNLRGGGSA